MAGVINSITTSPQGRPNSYATSPCSTNSALVSPSIVEAIDRIFPKSPSQLLSHPSFPEGNHHTSGGRRASSDATSQHSQPTNSNNNCVSSSMPCTVTMSHLPTDTTTTATAIFTGLTTSSGTKSPVMSSTPTPNHLDMPSLPAQAKVNQRSSLHKNNGAIDITPKRLSASPVKRISKVDLEMVREYSNNQSLRNGRSGRFNLPENDVCASPLKETSDSDDMCRPFINAQKEKKKRKKKRPKPMEESPVLSPSSPKMPRLQYEGRAGENEVRPQGNNSSVSNTLGEDDCPDLNGSQVLSQDPTTFSTSFPSVGDSLKWEYGPEFRRPTHRQILPRIKRRSYHTSKDSKRIKKAFPPSYVVLKKVDQLLLQDGDSGQGIEFDLSLKERVQILSSLCRQYKIPCFTRKKSFHNVFDYKTLPDDSTVYTNSEDEFRIPQGRSLRKRRQNICYVEPSEDDLIMDDLSEYSQRKKRSGQLKKDEIPNREREEEPEPEMTSLPTMNSEAPIETSPEKSEKKKKKKKKSKTCENEAVAVSTQPSNASSWQSAVFTAPFSTSYAMAKSLTAPKSVTSTTATSSSNPNLVYVYPKKTVVSGAGAQTNITASSASSDALRCHPKKPLGTSSSSTGPRIGPASKTNRPSNIGSKTPVTTLSFPPSTTKSSASVLPMGFTGLPLAAGSLPHNIPLLATGNANNSLSQQGGNLPASNLCMVKIDGKDFLISMPPGSSKVVAPQIPTPVTTPIPFSQPGLVPAGGVSPRIMVFQPGSAGGVPVLRPAVLAPNSASLMTTKSLASTSLSVPHMSTAVTLPGRSSTSTIHLLPTSLPGSALSPSLLSGGQAMLLSTAGAAAAGSSPSLGSSLSSAVQRPVNLVSQKPSSSSSQGYVSSTSSSSLLQSLSSGMTSVAASGARQVRSLVTPLMAPGATTVIRQQVAVSSSAGSVQLVAPSASSVSGTRCFRIIVPACSATGSTARIATLGTSAMQSPLTRLSASSSLLPQRKQIAADKDISPEKRAARRRRLEKKYPLPPGVVIKTESLDSPPASSSSLQSGAVRSLLSGQNIQVIAAASRSGVGGVQRFRIIAPSGISAPGGVMVGSRPVRLGSNVIIRPPLIAPSTSRVSSFPAPSVVTLASSSSLLSASLLTSTTITTTTTATVSASAAVSVVSSQSEASTSSSPAASVSSSAAPSRGTISLLSPGTLLLSSSAATGSSSTASGSCLSATSLAGGLETGTNQATANRVVTRAPSAQETPQDQPSSSGSKTSDGSLAGGEAAMATMRESVKKLRTLIEAQEGQGLKGARLDKLKQVLHDKEKLLAQMELEASRTVADASQDSEDADGCGGTTLDDPVVID